MLRWWLAIALLGVSSAAAQVIDATQLGESVKLEGQWRIHAGDDPQWAQPGPAWADWICLVPCRVRLPRKYPGLSLLVVEGLPYEVFVNGVSLGGNLSFPA